MSLAVIFLFESTLTGDGEARRDGRGGIRPASQSDLALLVPWAGADFGLHSPPQRRAYRWRPLALPSYISWLAMFQGGDMPQNELLPFPFTAEATFPQVKGDLEQRFPGCRVSGSLRLQA